MKPTQYIAILFCMMIFGSFASFAQNDWGNTVIFFGQLGIILVFIFKIVDVAKNVCDDSPSSFSKWLFRAFRVMMGFYVILSMTMITKLLFNPEGQLSTFLDGIQSITSKVYFFFTLPVLGLYSIIGTVSRLIRKMDIAPYRKVWECLLVILIFTGFVIKFHHQRNGYLLFILGGVVLLLFYYLFFIGRLALSLKRNGGKSVLILVLASISAISNGIAIAAKLLHWKQFMFDNGHLIGNCCTIAMLCYMVFISGIFKSDGRDFFDFKKIKQRASGSPVAINNTPVSIIGLFYYFKNSVGFLVIITAVYANYIYLLNHDLAPRFFSQKYPSSIDKMTQTNTMDMKSMIASENKAREAMDCFDAFVIHCEDNGLIK